MVHKIASGVVALLAFAITPSLALWPLPTSLSSGSSALKLSPFFEITVSVRDAPSDLEAAVSRTRSYLFADQLQRLVVDRGASDASTVQRAPSLSSLILTVSGDVASIASEVTKPLEERSESYTLTIPSDGKAATLTAKSTLGLFRGLSTFQQIWYYINGDVYTLEAPFQISDSPAYPFRGLMLDSARNYLPVADILRTLDTMALLNTFHWHVVDSQSFPLEISGFSDLASKGAYDSSSVYTASDVEEIVTYANQRGIDVLAEIDTPGHTAVIANAYPEHIACADATPWASFANEPPAGQLRLASPATQSFTASLLTAAAKMFTSPYFSTGGDEVNANCYAQDSETQSELTSQGITFNQALNTFTMNNHAALEKIGKTPVVWEEMVLDYNLTLSKETLVMVWISSADVLAVAQQGFKIVHASSDYFYLDCGGGGWVGDDVGGNSWCDPFKTWQDSYSFDPIANLTSEQAALVQGGEELLWTEQSGDQNLDPIVWPRAASSAELFWSGGGGNVTAALPRLHDVSYRMRQRGVKSINLQPVWCALRPNACDLTA